MNPWLAILLVLLALGGTQYGVAGLGRRLRLHPETMRKSVHVLMGLVCACFPVLFAEAWPVVLLTILAIAWLLACQKLVFLRDRLGAALHNVERHSYGDAAYCLGVGLLFWVAQGNGLFYIAPLLVLTFADTAAALCGMSLGRSRYQSADGVKSLEGTLAFYAVAWICIVLALVCLHAVPGWEALLVAAPVAAATALLEAVSMRGSDNLIIPLGCFVLLKYALVMPAAMLAILLIMLTLLGMSFFFQRRLVIIW